MQAFSGIVGLGLTFGCVVSCVAVALSFYAAWLLGGLS